MISVPHVGDAGNGVCYQFAHLRSADCWPARLTSQVSGSVIAEVTGVDPAAAGVRTAVTATAASLAKVPGVRNVATPFDGVSPGMVATDGSGLLIEVTMADFDDDAARSTAVGKLLTTFWLHCAHRVTSHYGRVMPHNASHG